MIGKKVIVRADRAGVFYGVLKEKSGNEVTLTDCRRLWCWYGAASISQLAVEGTKRPNDCNYPVALNRCLRVVRLNIGTLTGTITHLKQNLNEYKKWVFCKLNRKYSTKY